MPVVGLEGEASEAVADMGAVVCQGGMMGAGKEVVTAAA